MSEHRVAIGTLDTWVKGSRQGWGQTVEEGRALIANFICSAL